MKRILTGIKPSGELTLGNYIGAIKQIVLEQDNYESFIFIMIQQKKIVLRINLLLPNFY